MPTDSSTGARVRSPGRFHARLVSLSSSRKVTMDLTFTLADLTATSACELRLYTELRERAQKQSAHPTHEKLERAREAYRECLRVLTEGGMVGQCSSRQWSS